MSATTNEMDNIRERAAEWIVQLQEAQEHERASLLTQCETWQAADPRHRQVMQQMAELWQALDPAREKQRRQRRVRGLGLFVAVIALSSQLPWSHWSADYRSAPGQVLALTLPDGSQLSLNSGSAVNLDFESSQRNVHLLTGELHVVVAKEANRPFQVITDHASATALGTQYRVQSQSEITVVSVQESRVSVKPTHSSATHILDAGDRAQLSSDQILSTEQTTSAPPDWLDRRLVFQDSALRDVVERLERHRRGLIHVADSVPASTLRFTGSLPLEDSDLAIKVLADSLGLQVLRVTPWYIRLESP